jgi:hypothetical protein
MDSWLLKRLQIRAQFISFARVENKCRLLYRRANFLFYIFFGDLNELSQVCDAGIIRTLVSQLFLV